MPAPASAQPVATFSSPLLASVDRLVSRVGSLVDSPQFGSRSLRFADHILSLRLPGSFGTFGSAGFGGFRASANPNGPAEIGPRADGGWAAQASGHAASPWGMLLPTPWIPSAETLRGGRGPSRQQPVATAIPKSTLPQPALARPVVPAPTAVQPGPVVPQPGVPTASLPLVAPELRSDELRPTNTGRPIAAPTPAFPIAAAPVGPHAEVLTDTRVRDWLVPTPAPVAGLLAPELPIQTPMARSFGHLIWSDLRLLHSPSLARELTGTVAPQLPVAPSLQGPVAPLAPAGRAAAPMSLPMVRALDLVPESVQRPGAVVSRREDNLPARPQLSSEPAAVVRVPTQPSPQLLGAEAAPVTVGQAQSATPPSLSAAEPAARAPERSTPALPFVAPAELVRRDLVPAAAAPRAPLASVLSPSLFASPALGAPTPGGSLLALAASAFPAAAPVVVPGSQAERSLSPWPTLGGLATSVERFATSVGSRAAGASAGLGNPFGGVDSWRSAPGLPAVLTRSLVEASTAVRAVPELALPFVSAPRGEAAASDRRQPMAAALTRPFVAASMGQPAQAAESVRPSLGALPPMPSVAPFLPAGEGHASTSAPPSQAQGAVAAPWRQAGGLATLAELFAAGVGLTTGAAGGVAQQAGVTAGAPLMPAWFPRTFMAPVSEAAAPSTNAPARMSTVPSLVMPAPAWPVAAGVAPRVARAFAETQTVMPSAPTSQAAVAQGAARSSLPQAVAPSAASAGPLWHVAGGLAATAESFARDRGIAASTVDLGSRGASLGELPAGPAPGRWLPLGGGLVFVPAARAPQVVPTLRSEASTAPSLAARPAGEAPAPSPVPRLFVAAPERAIPEAGVLSVGGIGLRSELFTSGLAAPSQGTAALAAWVNAPGLSPPMAQALGSRAAEATSAGGRWAVGERGLVFVSGPQIERTPTGREQQQLLGRAAPAAPVSGALAPTAATQAVTAPALPWLAAGGTAALAELFATGVVLGSGAASGLAERAGVASAPSGLASWMGAPLLNLLSSDALAATARPSAPIERAARPALALDWVQPERTASALRAAMAPRTPSVPQPVVAPTLTAPVLRAGELPTERPAQLTLQTQAGGLAASAEAFARDHGMAPSSLYVAAGGGIGAEAAPRFVPLAGGLVMIRPEAPERSAPRWEAQTAASRRNAPTLPTVEAARSAPERTVSWQQAGGVGARSELFALTLGPAPSEAGASLGGWGEQPLLTSLPREESSGSAPSARFGWSGPGGLVFLAPQLRHETASARPSLATPRSLPLGAPAWAERIAPATSRENPVAAESSPQRVAPSLTMLSAERPERVAPSSERRSDAAALQQRYARGILTSFPTENRGRGEDEQLALPPTQLQPQTVEQISRLSQLLGQLAQGSGLRLPRSVTAAWELSGAPGMPLWQRLQPELTQLASAIDSADESNDGDEFAPRVGPGARRPAMTMVQGTGARAPRSQPAQASSAPPPRQKSPEAVVSAAMASVAQSGGAAAASVRLLEALRSQAIGQGGRSDDRIALDDLTMVAISVGQNKMAAATNTAYSNVSATAEALVGHPNPPNVPDDEHAASQKVEAMAERVVKKLLDEDQLESERFGVA